MNSSSQQYCSIPQRHRAATVRAERERCSGAVEVDEARVGGAEHSGKPGRGSQKCVVLIAVQVKKPKGFGRVRMRHALPLNPGQFLPK